VIAGPFRHCTWLYVPISSRKSFQYMDLVSAYMTISSSHQASDAARSRVLNMILGRGQSGWMGLE
jgi:hypothetical protein